MLPIFLAFIVVLFLVTVSGYTPIVYNFFSGLFKQQISLFVCLFWSRKNYFFSRTPLQSKIADARIQKMYKARIIIDTYLYNLIYNYTIFKEKLRCDSIVHCITTSYRVVKLYDYSQTKNPQ